MKDIIIEVENLSKKYLLGQRIVGDLRSTLKKTFLNNIRKNQDQHQNADFWALKDISFQIKRGEVMGIVGNNGSGKSTLLKILSRITAPTTGKITITGKVSSLLEVGTGFHPELTGRENIFLYGSLLGMKKNEIKAKFDEIVDFSDIGKFIDTPVKNYSSGMYVRLAFSVSAHLEPDILIIDEVLAVGDIAFQKKCLEKMGEVASGGRTVIFVSHNLAALESLCNRGIFLEQGKVMKSGTTNEVLSSYLSRMSENTKLRLSERKDRKGKGILSLKDGFVTDKNNQRLRVISAGQEIKIVLIYQSNENDFRNVVVKIECKDQFGRYMFSCVNEISQGAFKFISGNGRFICTIPKVILNVGIYYLDFFIKANNLNQDIIMNGIELNVVPGAFYDTGLLPENKGVLLNYEWEVE